MEKTNLENLNKLAKLFGTDRLISPEEIQEIRGVLVGVLANNKKEVESLTAETRELVNKVLNKVLDEHDTYLEKTKQIAQEAKSDTTEAIQATMKSLEEVKKLCKEVMECKPENGKDADEEYVIGEVLNRIKLPEYKEVVLDDGGAIVDKINALPVNEENQIDAKHIKNLPEVKGGRVISGGVTRKIVEQMIEAAGGGSQNLQQVLDTGNTATESGSGNTMELDHSGSGHTLVLNHSGSGDALQVNGNAVVTGNLTVDTNTLYVDATNNRVGIGTTSPQLAIHANSSDEAQLILSGTQNAVGETSGVDFRYFNGGANTNIARILAYTQSGGGGDLLFQTASSGAGTYSTKVKINRAGQFIVDVNNGSNSVLTLTDGASYGEIQTFNSKPLYLNRQGNNIVLFGGTAGLLGINTTAPTHTLTLASTGTGIALYNTADQTTNYERGLLEWSGNELNLRTISGGTGTNRALRLGSRNASGNQTAIYITRSGSPFIQFEHDSTGVTGDIYRFTGTTAASSSTYSCLTIEPTINQSSTAGYTALLVNPTETTTGSGSKLLADFQVGGSSKLSISNAGKLVQSASAEGAVPAAGATSTFLNITAGAQYGIIAGVLGSGKSYIQAQRVDASATTYNLQLQPNGGAVEVGSTIELGNASDTTLSRSSAGVLAVEGVVVDTISAANTLTNKTLTTPTINGATITGDFQTDGIPNTDDTWTGKSTNSFNAGGTIAQFDCVYLTSSSTWALTDADAIGTGGNTLVMMAGEAGTNGNPLRVIEPGSWVRNDAWNWTVGGALYLDTATPGGMTQTIPSGTDDVVKIMGHAVTADVIYFNPSVNWIIRV